MRETEGRDDDESRDETCVHRNFIPRTRRNFTATGDRFDSTREEGKAIKSARKCGQRLSSMREVTAAKNCARAEVHRNFNPSLFFTSPYARCPNERHRVRAIFFTTHLHDTGAIQLSDWLFKSCKIKKSTENSPILQIFSFKITKNIEKNFFRSIF